MSIEMENVFAQKFSSKPNLLRFLRVSLSIFLITVILSKIDLAKWPTIARSANIPGLVLAFLLVILSLVISAFTWQKILGCLNTRVSIKKLTTTYFIGLFFNNFLPTSIGGDVVRIYRVGRHTERAAEVTASVIIERLFGAFTLGLTALLAVLVSFDRSRPFFWLIVLFFLLCAAMLGVSMKKECLQFLSSRLFPERFNLEAKARSVFDAVHRCLRKKTSLFWVFVLSLVFQLTVVLINFVIFKSLGFSVSLVYCLIFTPLISALSMLPISVNGLGVREGGYIYFFSKVGLSITQSVSASLVFFVLVVAASLIGGMIFAFQR